MTLFKGHLHRKHRRRMNAAARYSRLALYGVFSLLLCSAPISMSATQGEMAKRSTARLSITLRIPERASIRSAASVKTLNLPLAMGSGFQALRRYCDKIGPLPTASEWQSQAPLVLSDGKVNPVYFSASLATPGAFTSGEAAAQACFGDALPGSGSATLLITPI